MGLFGVAAHSRRCGDLIEQCQNAGALLDFPLGLE
jgi:hypothetical protein